MANIGKKERVDERKARHIMGTMSRMWLHEMPTEQKREHILESLRVCIIKKRRIYVFFVNIFFYFC
jgi:hypothetical protein